MLTDAAQRFLSKSPTHIATVMGFRFFEHPVFGDEAPLVAITPEGKKWRTDFLETPEPEDVSDWAQDRAQAAKTKAPADPIAPKACPKSRARKHITATFSSGFSDTYKGHRPVTAAWMITHRDTGKVYASGHSLDRQKAEKTARNSIPKADSLPAGWKQFRHTPAMIQYVRRKGFRTTGEYAQSVREANAEKAKDYAIEVIDL